jgi:ferric-dicitrate binding protein FerR (iron transport regulator)
VSSTPPQPSDELARLLIKLTDGRLSEDETLRLRELLRNDSRELRAYVHYMSTNAMLAWRFASQGRPSAGDSGAPLDPAPADLAEPITAGAENRGKLQGHEALYGFRFQDSAGAEDDEPEPLPAPPAWTARRSAPPPRRWGLISGIAAAALVTATVVIALMNGSSARPQQSQQPATVRSPTNLPETAPVQPPTQPAPLPPTVAHLTGSVGAEWLNPDLAPLPDGAIPAGRQLSLSRGFAELRFNGGAIVVVEAPARFTVDSEKTMSLASGRVAPTAAGKAAGFIVRTALADVIDLGTQFGVEVGSAGATNVHVFEGRVQAAMKKPPADNGAGPAPATLPSPILKVGDAGRLTATGVTITPGAASPQTFVRDLTTAAAHLDLVDLICGGDGTSRRKGLGIDRRDGTVGTPALIGHVTEENAFRRAVGMPIIDGFFFPGPQGGPTKVDSAGHQFDFPAGVGRTFNHIWTGGQIPWPEKKSFLTKLGNVDYAGDDHRVLELHASNGLTLDLDQIRRLHPARKLTGFRAVFGNTAVRPNADGLMPRADAFVLVDGQSRFERRGFTNRDGAIAVDIPIADTDRFLTLATTDGGDGDNNDWVIFGDPRVILGDR